MGYIFGTVGKHAILSAKTGVVGTLELAKHIYPSYRRMNFIRNQTLNVQGVMQ